MAQGNGEVEKIYDFDDDMKGWVMNYALVYTDNKVIESYIIANLWYSKANKTIQPSLIIFLFTITTI